MTTVGAIKDIRMESSLYEIRERCMKLEGEQGVYGVREWDMRLDGEQRVMRLEEEQCAYS